ncbi:MAG: hypothetical protein AAGA67_08230, partial [Cyanobacteria bacterium P01_F01_bin.153]
RIAAHLRDKGTATKITAANVTQYSWSSEPTKEMDADSIRAYFPIIAATNVGTIEGTGNAMVFVVNQDYRHIATGQ